MMYKNGEDKINEVNKSSVSYNNMLTTIEIKPNPAEEKIEIKKHIDQYFKTYRNKEIFC